MKRNNKKGFTIVELVIVIAVIAILSAVMIPTFSGITAKAQESARDQEAANIMKEYLINHDYKAMDLTEVDGYIVVDNHLYTVTDANVAIDGDQPTGTAPTGYVAVNGVYLACNSHVDTNTHNLKCDNCGADVACDVDECPDHPVAP